MDIEEKLKKIIINARRDTIKFNTVFAGDKEKKELKLLKFPDGFVVEKNSDYVVKVLYINKDSFLKVGYVHDN